MTRSKFGPAAGTRKGKAPDLALVRPPAVVTLRQEEMTRLRILSDIQARGLYELLLEVADFTRGEVLVTYASLIAWCTPPRPQHGRARPGPSYEQLRRLVRDLEFVGLVSRDRQANEAHGQLRVRLPFLVARVREWEKTRAQRESAQGLAQGSKGRKAA